MYSGRAVSTGRVDGTVPFEVSFIDW
jgi:hypothetical protein